MLQTYSKSAATMITIAVVNSKGGVGKTTLTAALSVVAAQEDGARHRVGIVDLDPQQSLAKWWARRGSPKEEKGGPTILPGVDSAIKAVELATESGLFDVLFLDGPPAFLTTMEEMIAAADFTLIPIKPSVVDLLATEDAVVLARDRAAGFLCVFNDVAPKEKAVEKARAILFNNEVPIADTQVMHRAAHVTGMNIGKSGAEVRGAVEAARDIADLWAEVQPLAVKASRKRARVAARHG
jgi:chromosome partitioning protein